MKLLNRHKELQMRLLERPLRRLKTLRNQRVHARRQLQTSRLRNSKIKPRSSRMRPIRKSTWPKVRYQLNSTKWCDWKLCKFCSKMPVTKSSTSGKCLGQSTFKRASAMAKTILITEPGTFTPRTCKTRIASSKTNTKTSELALNTLCLARKAACFSAPRPSSETLTTSNRWRTRKRDPTTWRTTLTSGASTCSD